MSSQSPGVGARLKKVRLEKGLTFEDMHKKTKIHLNILKSIEEDNLLQFNPAYIKGFLKIYCKALDLNPQDFIPDYKEIMHSSSSVKAKKEEKRAGFVKDPSLRLKPLNPKIKIKTVVIIIGIIFIIFGLFKIPKLMHPRGKKALLKPPTLDIPVKKIEKKSENTKLQKSPVASIVRLGIRTKDNCYIHLKSDGKVVFQGILKKGRFEVWQAKDKIELTLGNAGVVELEVNGRLISNLGRKKQALKNILITKEGLNINR